MRAKHVGLLRAMAMIAWPIRAEPIETVRLGINGMISDAPIFIAVERGYFRAQGIEAACIPIETGSEVVAAGVFFAGIFNPAVHGIVIKIVADTASTPRGRATCLCRRARISSIAAG
jgi:NitT/TauT family transport system substrate-binding protein